MGRARGALATYDFHRPLNGTTISTPREAGEKRGASGRASARLIVAALAVVLVGCTADEPDAAAPPVHRIARQIADAGGDRVIVFVSDDGREHEATAGSRRPAPDERFRIGSVTKTFTAAIVLQLVEEARLRLDDTVERHLPGVVPSGTEITIRQLLAHRSGLANATDFPDWLDRVGRSATTRPVDILRFAASQPMAFAPDAEWGYSNTNYIALGLVIEKVTGETYRQQLEKRILEPLDLDDTELPRARRVEGLDDAGENPDLPWAAGALVSSTRDLARFFSALLSGDVVSESSLATMKERTVVDPGTGFASGLGIFSNDLSCGRAWGHDGGILDYATLVRATEDGERVAVISVHGGAPTGEPPDESALLCPPAASP